jgi:hypothetical protein
MPEPPALTRRRSADRPDCWHIYYGDVQAGTIAMRAGNPHDTEPWEWICGFYPGSRPGEIQSGTSETFEDARVEFASAWEVFLSKRTLTKDCRSFGSWEPCFGHAFDFALNLDLPARLDPSALPQGECSFVWLQPTQSVSISAQLRLCLN